MASTNNIQLSLLVEEAEVLKEEANRQMAVAVRKREEAIARGEKVGNLKQIAASTVAAQIIRKALPRLNTILEAEKEMAEELKKG